jgi:hypothetical protein
MGGLPLYQRPQCAMRWRRGSGFSLTAMIATDVLMLPPQA